MRRICSGRASERIGLLKPVIPCCANVAFANSSISAKIRAQANG
jgi:hypothetical protein